MTIFFRSFYNYEKQPEPIDNKMCKFCTSCKHMLFFVGQPKVIKNLTERRVYCNMYPGDHIPITSSQICRHFKLQYKYKRL